MTTTVTAAVAGRAVIYFTKTNFLGVISTVLVFSTRGGGGGMGIFVAVICRGIRKMPRECGKALHRGY